MEKPEEILKRLIRNEFDNIDDSMEFVYNKAERLIHTARTYGLNDLAEEMQNDITI